MMVLWINSDYLKSCDASLTNLSCLTNYINYHKFISKSLKPKFYLHKSKKAYRTLVQANHLMKRHLLLAQLPIVTSPQEMKPILPPQTVIKVYLLDKLYINAKSV